MTTVVGVEEVGSDRVAAAVPLAFFNVQNYPHCSNRRSNAQAGSKTSGRYSSDRSPGVYSSTVPSASS